MKNPFSISNSDSDFDDLFLQAITDDSIYSSLESISENESLSNFPMPDTKISLFELPEPDLELPSQSLTITGPAFVPKFTFSSPDRQEKIRRYLEKKRKRTWQKKIHYSCRKKVADQRIRVKGRFVSKEQAQSLGFPVLEIN